MELQFVPVVSAKKVWEKNPLWEVLMQKHEKEVKMPRTSGLDAKQIQRLKAMGEMLRASFVVADEYVELMGSTEQQEVKAETNLVKTPTSRKKAWKERASRFQEKANIQEVYSRQGGRRHTDTQVKRADNAPVKQGYLEAVGSFNVRKLYWFELYHGRLESFKVKGGKRSSSRCLVGPWQLREYNLDKVSFAFEIRAANKTLLLIAENSKERAEWLLSLKSALRAEVAIASPPKAESETKKATYKLTHQERINLGEELEALRVGLEKDLQHNMKQKLEAVDKEDYYGAARYKTKIEEIQELLSEYESIRAEELEKLGEEIKKVELELQDLNARKRQAASVENFVKALQLKEEQEECIKSIEGLIAIRQQFEKKEQQHPKVIHSLSGVTQTRCSHSCHRRGRSPLVPFRQSRLSPSSPAPPSRQNQLKTKPTRSLFRKERGVLAPSRRSLGVDITQHRSAPSLTQHLKCHLDFSS